MAIHACVNNSLEEKWNGFLYPVKIFTGAVIPYFREMTTIVLLLHPGAALFYLGFHDPKRAWDLRCCFYNFRSTV